VTAGLALPDGIPTETAGAVIVSAEDGASDTIRPRFDAAGGDPNRALLLGDDEPFAIPADIPKLERAVRQVSATLVVIDPIMAFLSGDVNLKSCRGEAWCAVPLVSGVTILGTPLWAARCAALLRYRDLSSVVHREFIENSLMIHCFYLPCVCRLIQETQK